MAQGGFIVSLDFELHWGLRDAVRLAAVRDHLLRAREAIPEVLRLFQEFEISATWATVGFLFARDKRHLTDHLPALRPHYAKRALDPYAVVDEIGEDEKADPFHYAASILQKVAATEGQEIASHTFSHFYCLEDGQTAQCFEADMRAAAAIGEPFGQVTQTLVFPRGQHNPAYDSVLAGLGVRTYRAPPRFFPYRPHPIDRETSARRALRLADSYLPLGGYHADRPRPDSNGIVPLHAGLFLRPFSPSRRAIEPLRIRRMHDAMKHAARHQLDFHLWWHPHNFGSNTRENLQVLRSVLADYRALRERFGWPSRTMAEASQVARENA